MTGTTIIDGCTVVTMDSDRSEYPAGHVIVTGPRITAVAAGAAPPGGSGDRYIDAGGCLATPGLVNTHHHLYQWLTRGLATDSGLFDWLTELYPVWEHIDAEVVAAAARAGLAWLAMTGCSTTTDHHYVFPHDGGDVLAATIEMARQVGLRFQPTRGSMDLGYRQGGLPPDTIVENLDQILTATQAAIDAYHDPQPESMLRIAVAPCSPFSVTAELLARSADLARRNGVRLHTHLAETLNEDEYCRQHFGRSPVEYLNDLGWLGADVWLAHTVHLDDSALALLASSGTGVAHCPSSNARLGAGVARATDLRRGGVPVGLGVDGTASNEASSLLEEARHALLFARARSGPAAMTTRDALEMATMGGARVLGREGEIGSLEPGKLADIALWRLDALPHAGIADPVAALLLGPPPPLDLLLVQGQPVVERGRVLTIDAQQAAADAAAASRRLLARAGPG